MGGASLGGADERIGKPLSSSTSCGPSGPPCSRAGRVTLNRELLDLPRELGEYVIVHELAHQLAPHHGKLFKSFLFAYLPDWPERETRLRGHE